MVLNKEKVVNTMVSVLSAWSKRVSVPSYKMSVENNNLIVV